MGHTIEIEETFFGFTATVKELPGLQQTRATRQGALEDLETALREYLRAGGDQDC